jgi:general secretion pathway protein J
MWPKRNHSPDQRESCRGFTLLEVLVALALLAIISAALYGTYFSLMRGRDAAQTRMTERRELSTTLDRLRRELAAVCYRAQSTGSSQPAAGDQQSTQLHFVVEDRDYFGKPASTLDFTALAPPPGGNLPASDQVRIRYRVVEKDGKLSLMRMEKDRYVTADPLPYPQLEDLEGFLVECSGDGAQWVKTWDTAINHGLPQYVRVTVRLKEGEKTVALSAIITPMVK